MGLTYKLKSIWHYIERFKIDNNTPNTLTQNDKSSTGKSGLTKLFKESFGSIYSTKILNIGEYLEKLKYYTGNVNNQVLKSPLSKYVKLFNSLDFNSCPGPDGALIILLCSC